MTDPTSRDLDALTAEPDDLDGHTIEQLADYLDTGRTPSDPTIEDSPACRRALAALGRLRAVSPEILTDDGPDYGDDWVDALMSRIGSDARAGADLLLDTTPDGHQIVITEGALRALIRAAVDDEPGVLAGRTRAVGDLTDPDDTFTVELDLAVVHGTAIPGATERVRRNVIDLLTAHTRSRHIQVDITVRDLILGEETA